MTLSRKPAQNEARVVALYSQREREQRHEQASHTELARRLARLQQLEFVGEYDATQDYRAGVYLVPTDTIVGLDNARRLGIANEEDLFGGVVPQRFVSTKAITHPLAGPDACAPPGWSHEFGRRVHDAVLPGISAFSVVDAQHAGARLLQSGPIRIKPVLATAGRGQRVVHTPAALSEALRGLDIDEISACGLVLERNLENVTTHSVGQVRVAGLTATYYGTQGLTTDHSGETVYGGSTLTVARGGFDALLALELPHAAHQAVGQAQIYDAAASDCFSGFFASRRNYDIAEGNDAQGRHHCGVLEQSWRIGGASSAEVLALEAFSRDPSLRYVCASSLEYYDEAREPPADALVLYRGEDDEVGFITKCAYIASYGNT
nr:DUF3182 family protein [Pseudomonas sp.]